MKKLLLVCVIGIFLFTNCSDNGNNPYSTNEDLWPFVLGNTWIYTFTTYYSSNRNKTTEIDTVTYFVSDTVHAHGEIWYKLSMTRPHYGTNELDMVYTVRDNGLWGFENKDTSDIDPSKAMQMFKYPFSITDPFYARFNITTGVEVVTPKGKFNTVRFISPDENNYGWNGLFYCPGIGRIKSEYIAKIYDRPTLQDTLWVKEVLIDYKLYPKK